MRLDAIERWVASHCARWGAFVARHPEPLVVLPLLFTALACTGFLTVNKVTDATYLFTPQGAQSKFERQTFHEQWPTYDGNYWPGKAVLQAREIQVTVTAVDDKNILSGKHSESVNALDNFIRNEVKVTHDGQVYAYEDLCLHWSDGTCLANRHVEVVSHFFNNGINVTYPIFNIGQQSIYLASSLGGALVWREPKTNEMVVASAKSWLFLYHLKFHPKNTSYVSGLWEKELEAALRNYETPNGLQITLLHSQSLSEELGRNADSLRPRFALSFVLLMLFALLCSMQFLRDAWLIDWAMSRPWLAASGLLSAGMAVVTGCGVLMLAQMPYTDIVSVMPFLVIAVGVDNMFLMLAACGRTRRGAPVEKRLAAALEEAAVSIMITTATDCVSFGIGTITSIPAVFIFCTYTALAIFFTFVYQLTFFTALLVYSLRWENDARNATFFCITWAAEARANAPFLQRLFNLGSRVEPNAQVYPISPTTAIEPTPTRETVETARAASSHNQKSEGDDTTIMPPASHPRTSTPMRRAWRLAPLETPRFTTLPPKPETQTVHKQARVQRNHHHESSDVIVENESRTTEFFKKIYVPLLMQPVMRALVVLWYLAYMGVAIFGCMQIKKGLEPVNLLVQDSYAIPHYRTLQNYFWKYGATLQIAVNSVPDLTDPAKLARVSEAVERMAATQHSAGPDTTQFWYYQMKKYYADELNVEIDGANFYELLRRFAASPDTEQWVADLRWNDTRQSRLSAFRLTTGLRDIQSTVGQQEATRQFRDVAALYPDLNITTFMPLWLFTDQYELVIPNTVQNIVIALACMIVIAALLIPNPMCAVFVALACASIDAGVIGYMTLWNVNLDAISMITIIMAIGFSVDYSAHITYGYVVSRGATPAERVHDALSTLGWPLVQGGTSTILGVSVLASVPAYMVVTFFKTVFLAISFGLVHGLIFLPVFLTLVVRGGGGGKDKKRKKEEEEEKNVEEGKEEAAEEEESKQTEASTPPLEEKGEEPEEQQEQEKQEQSTAPIGTS